MALRTAPVPPPHVRLVLGSELQTLDRVVDEAQSFLRSHITDEDFIYRVVLLTTEAVTNAIEHGNAEDPEKYVVLDLSVETDRVTVCVEDEGSGFDPTTIRNPLAEQNLLRDGGRGLFLIEQMADEVTFERGGRRLKMSFNRS